MSYLNNIYNTYIQVTPLYNRSWEFATIHKDFIKFIIYKCFKINNPDHTSGDKWIKVSLNNHIHNIMVLLTDNKWTVASFIEEGEKRITSNTEPPPNPLGIVTYSDRNIRGLICNYKTGSIKFVGLDEYKIDLWFENESPYFITRTKQYLESNSSEWIEEYNDFTKKLSAKRSYQERINSKSRLERQKQRVVKFTYADQKLIALEILNTIIKQNETMGYVLNLALDYWRPSNCRKLSSKSESVDLTGEKLLDALDVFSIDKSVLLEGLLHENAEACKRFAVLLGDNEFVGLVDQDEKVRLAARLKIEKQRNKV